MAKLTLKIRDKVLRHLYPRDLPDLPEQEGDPLPFDSPLLGDCYAASIQGRIGLGENKGAYIHREGRMKDAPFFAFTGERCAQAEGFTLHANVRIHGRKRKRLERLVRYVARPALSTERLERLPDGRVYYRLKKPYHDGTKGIVFSPLTFIEKLCALVPPPRRIACIKAFLTQLPKY